MCKKGQRVDNFAENLEILVEDNDLCPKIMYENAFSVLTFEVSVE